MELGDTLLTISGMRGSLFSLFFHQIHHSASRIEIPTNSFITAILLCPTLGYSILATFWYNFFATTGEYFYHASLKSPRWLRYLIQTPEPHSVHHQFDAYSFNFGDLQIWGRLFGTYQDRLSFTERCGFPEGAEQRLAEMFRFRDVYDDDDEVA